ncbi:hypothetical protein, partial [Mycobacterium tuberculosis]
CVMPLPRRAKAKLATPVGKGSPHVRFMRSLIRYMDDGLLYAEPLAFSKSSMMASIADAEALTIIPAGPNGLEAGQWADIILLPL